MKYKLLIQFKYKRKIICGSNFIKFYVGHGGPIFTLLFNLTITTHTLPNIRIYLVNKANENPNTNI